jgi:hypothetical protein
VFNFRASVRTAGLVAGTAALVLGLFAGSAFAWYSSEGTGGNDQTPTVPTSSNGPPAGSENGDNKHDTGGKPSSGDHPSTGEKPGGGKKGGGKKGETTQPAPPVAESTPAPSPVPVATGLLPAPPRPAAAVAPAPIPAPTTPAAATAPPVVKGEIGTVTNRSGGRAPTVLAAAGQVGQSAGQGGGLARTGFDLLPVAILGGLALGGSAFFFRRLQGC